MIKVVSGSATLLITPKMEKQAYQNVCQVIADIDIDTFLELTTNSRSDIIWLEDTAQPLEKYNYYARTGETLVMPMLQIDADKGKVTSHEGRHRAVALRKEGARKMPVALQIRGKSKSKYDYVLEDLGTGVRGQYGRGYMLTKALVVRKNGWDR